MDKQSTNKPLPVRKVITTGETIGFTIPLEIIEFCGVKRGMVAAVTAKVIDGKFEITYKQLT